MPEVSTPNDGESETSRQSEGEKANRVYPEKTISGVLANLIDDWSQPLRSDRSSFWNSRALDRRQTLLRTDRKSVV